MRKCSNGEVVGDKYKRRVFCLIAFQRERLLKAADIIRKFFTEKGRLGGDFPQIAMQK